MLSSIARAMFPSISPFISMIMESEKSANKNQGKVIYFLLLFFCPVFNATAKRNQDNSVYTTSTLEQCLKGLHKLYTFPFKQYTLIKSRNLLKS